MAANQERYDLALSFWTAAFQYLIFVQNVAQETASQGNVWVVLLRFVRVPFVFRKVAPSCSGHTHILAVPD